jgi:aminoglycoside 3-N-acetyltransferase
MNEGHVIQRTETPATLQSLKDDLHQLGLQPGMVVLVHSSLSALGWVCGGAVTVILALEEVLGSTGTLVMPTHSADLTEPSKWTGPPVPASWCETIRETMPAYDPDLTPTRGMGTIPEIFRKQRGVSRSLHPQSSFSAWGRHAEQIIQDHALEDGLGNGSPLARIYDLDGWVLLLGVGHDSNTSLHLAEYRTSVPAKKVIQEGAPIFVDGVRTWKIFDDTVIDESDFEDIGAAFIEDGGGVALRRGKVGLADCQLIAQRNLVDFAIGWIESNRV